jgi:hypothetical protein
MRYEGMIIELEQKRIFNSVITLVVRLWRQKTGFAGRLIGS